MIDELVQVIDYMQQNDHTKVTQAGNYVEEVSSTHFDKIQFILLTEHSHD